MKKKMKDRDKSELESLRKEIRGVERKVMRDASHS